MKLEESLDACSSNFSNLTLFSNKKQPFIKYRGKSELNELLSKDTIDNTYDDFKSSWPFLQYSLLEVCPDTRMMESLPDVINDSIGERAGHESYNNFRNRTNSNCANNKKESSFFASSPWNPNEQKSEDENGWNKARNQGWSELKETSNFAPQIEEEKENLFLDKRWAPLSKELNNNSSGELKDENCFWPITAMKCEEEVEVPDLEAGAKAQTAGCANGDVCLDEGSLEIEVVRFDISDLPTVEKLAIDESVIMDLLSDDSDGDDDLAGGKCEHTSTTEKENTTLRSFLSKFDSKVAAIWGEETCECASVSRNRENGGYLAISSNPWFDDGTSSGIESDRQLTHVKAHEYNRGQMDIVNDFDDSESWSEGDCEDETEVPYIMISLKKHFGPAPPWPEYRIIRPFEADFSEEETMHSLGLLNHSNNDSDFKRFIPRIRDIYQEEWRNSAYDEEMELYAVQSRMKMRDKAVPGEDLLYSSRTHFNTVSCVELQEEDEEEETASENKSEAICSSVIPSNLINHDLPELLPFDENAGYSLFKNSPRTAFPVTFKVIEQNDKSCQTEEVIFMFMKFSANGFKSFKLREPDPRASMQQFYENGNPFLDDISPQGHSSNHYPNIWNAEVYDQAEAEVTYGESDENDETQAPYFEQYEYASDFGYNTDYAGAASAGYASEQNYAEAYDYSVSQPMPLAEEGFSEAANTSQEKKPCKYYFTEGSCKRGKDCKFSHTLVTCRYWAEGSCLKGSCCLFLHGYIDRSQLPNNEDQKELERPHEIESEFKLESESDFPTLTSTNIENRSLSSREKSVESDVLSKSRPEKTVRTGRKHKRERLESIKLSVSSGVLPATHTRSEPGIRRSINELWLLSTPKTPKSNSKGTVSKSNSCGQNGDHFSESIERKEKRKKKKR